jgi:hypothetical protein
MLCGALFSHVGLAWVLPKRVVDLFTCWKGPSKPNCVEDGIFLCFVVSLEERNDRSLEDSEGWWQNSSLSFSKLFIIGQLL